jgi:AcrR family transcriptional regulator
VAAEEADLTVDDLQLTSASPRSQKGARTRARLVEAAKEVFEENGLPEARIADIAARAGVSYGSFYHYFDSKEEAFREVAADADARLNAPLDDVIFVRGSEATPEERVREGIRRHFSSYREEARLLGVIEQAARLDDEVGAARQARARESSAQVADSIRQLQRRGLADPDLDPTVAAAALGAMTYRFAELWLARGELDCDFEAGVDTVARLFTNALGLTCAVTR